MVTITIEDEHFSDFKALGLRHNIVEYNEEPTDPTRYFCASLTLIMALASICYIYYST